MMIFYEHNDEEDEKITEKYLRLLERLNIVELWTFHGKNTELFLCDGIF